MYLIITMFLLHVGKYIKTIFYLLLYSPQCHNIVSSRQQFSIGLKTHTAHIGRLYIGHIFWVIIVKSKIYLYYYCIFLIKIIYTCKHKWDTLYLCLSPNPYPFIICTSYSICFLYIYLFSLINTAT